MEHFSRSVTKIFMIPTWDERNIAIFWGVYMIRVRRIDLNGSQRLEKMFEHEMTKTKMRLQRKKISPSKKSKMAWMGRSGELLKFWLKIFQQIDDSGFNHVLAISQNMDIRSVLRVFYFQKKILILSCQVRYRQPSIYIYIYICMYVGIFEKLHKHLKNMFPFIRHHQGPFRDPSSTQNGEPFRDPKW